MIRMKHKDITDKSPLAPIIDEVHSEDFLARLNEGVFEVEDVVKKSKKFKNDFCRQVYYLAKLGARDEDIAEFFRIDVRMVDTWKTKNTDFMTSWIEGKMIFGMKIAETLGQRALGYDYVETEYAEHMSRSGQVRMLKKTVNKHMPPDPACIFFYLKNQFRRSWADVNKTEFEATINVDIAKKLDINVLNEQEQNLLKGVLIKSIAQTHGVSNN